MSESNIEIGKEVQKALFETEKERKQSDLEQGQAEALREHTAI